MSPNWLPNNFGEVLHSEATILDDYSTIPRYEMSIIALTNSRYYSAPVTKSAAKHVPLVDIKACYRLTLFGTLWPIAFCRLEPPTATDIGSISAQYAQHGGTAECPNVNNGCYTWNDCPTTTEATPPDSVPKRAFCRYLLFIQQKNGKNAARRRQVCVAVVIEDVRPMRSVLLREYTTLSNGSMGTPIRKWTWRTLRRSSTLSNPLCWLPAYMYFPS